MDANGPTPRQSPRLSEADEDESNANSNLTFVCLRTAERHQGIAEMLEGPRLPAPDVCRE